ncbi:MAG: hypothetical protein KY469_14685 [Actinobacteria bacterium]|nr:hypothetical protein [Actinomycetota bacterium]
MPQLPIHDGGASCDLDDQGAKRRNVEFADVVERGLRDRKRTPHGVRLMFEHNDRLEDDVRELVDHESRCCGFFSFDVDVTEDAILVNVSAPADKDAYLDALYQATDLQQRNRHR